MKRYMPECNYEEDGLESYQLTECAQGPVCTYEEAAAIIAEKDKEIAILTEQRESWKDEVMRARPVAFELESSLVKKFYPQFICMAGRERLNEILASVTGLVSGLKSNTDLQEQLRASNEALVAAQARIAELSMTAHDWINQRGQVGGDGDHFVRKAMIECLAVPDNLTVLAAHDKEVRAKAAAEEREACAKVCEAHAEDPQIIRMTKITDAPRSVYALDCAELIRMRSDAELRTKP